MSEDNQGAASIGEEAAPKLTLEQAEKVANAIGGAADTLIGVLFSKLDSSNVLSLVAYNVKTRKKFTSALMCPRKLDLPNDADALRNAVCRSVGEHIEAQRIEESSSYVITLASEYAGVMYCAHVGQTEGDVTTREVRIKIEQEFFVL